jgi:DNA polymerase III subunit epsilon
MAALILDRPIVVFDLETTGLLIDLDRIIEIALIKIFPDGREPLRLAQRFEPGIKIPVESIAIHGMTNADLVGMPRFQEKAGELYDIFNDADIGGFALKRLDIPMLTKEFERSGYHFSMDGRRVVDASTIYQMKERRNLSSAYKLYCGKELINAHSALADAEATYEIILAQLDRYPDLPKEVPALSEAIRAAEPNNVDPEGKLVWRDGEAFFNFGKYRYRSLADVARSEPDYLDWIVSKADFSKELVEICSKARRGQFPRRAAPPVKH